MFDFFTFIWNIIMYFCYSFWKAFRPFEHFNPYMHYIPGQILPTHAVMAPHTQPDFEVTSAAPGVMISEHDMMAAQAQPVQFSYQSASEKNEVA